MKTHLTLACAATLSLVSFVLPGDRVRFAVKESTKLAKVFEEKSLLHSTSISASFDGDEQEAEGVKLTLEDSSRVEVTDEYGVLKEGKPARLTRTYDKLGGKSLQKVELPEGMGGGESPDTEKERSSELEGKTVVFKLSEDGEEYKAAFADEKGDAELLEGLEEDMDLRGFLPAGEVAEDKSWEIEAKVFNAVLGTPGGDLKIKAADDKDDDEIDEQIRNNLKGKAKGTYKGQRDVDGHKCAVIALEAELETQAKDDKSGAGENEGLNEIELEFAVEGELLWDVEAGHFRKCALTTRIKMAWKQTMSGSDGGEKHELVQSFVFEGESEFSASIGG
jgi:hypothetical protein